MPIVSWYPQKVIAPCEAAFKPAAQGLEKVAQGMAPRKSGRLAAGTRMTYTSDTSGFLSVQGVPYAGAVIKGTKAHAESSSTPMPIGNGRFAYSVKHPATRGHPFLQQAAPAFKPLYCSTARGMMHMGF